MATPGSTACNLQSQQSRLPFDRRVGAGKAVAARKIRRSRMHTMLTRAAGTCLLAAQQVGMRHICHLGALGC